MNKRFSFGIFFLLLTFILPGKVLAFYESAGPGDLRANVYPANPGINQKTSINLASYLINLDSCTFVWKEDGATSQEGIGQKSFSFTTGKLGQTISITTAINCPDKNPMEKNWLFQTNDVEFLIPANTYVAPFYKGNSRISSNSSVKIVAMPQVFNATSELIPATNLIYRWTKNGKEMPISSGYGKNALSVQASEIPGTTNYSVAITTLSGETKVTKDFQIRTENPQVIIYENKPLLGLQYQKGQNKIFNLAEKETTLTAEPFFFSNSDLVNNVITFNWSMNNKKINSSPDGRSITIRQTDGQTGEATIELGVTNTTNVFSTAKKILTINFGQKTSLFGF